MIPGEILRRLYKRADFDEVPVAELLRRIVDLAVTFKVPPPRTAIPPAVEAPIQFIAIMPKVMIDELSGEAATLQIPPDELVRRAAIYYLIMRNRVAATPIAPPTVAA